MGIQLCVQSLCCAAGSSPRGGGSLRTKISCSPLQRSVARHRLKLAIKPALMVNSQFHRKVSPSYRVCSTNTRTDVKVVAPGDVAGPARDLHLSIFERMPRWIERWAVEFVGSRSADCKSPTPGPKTLKRCSMPDSNFWQSCCKQVITNEWGA